MKEKLFRRKVCKILVLFSAGVFAFIVNTQKYGTEVVREIAENVFTMVPVLILLCYFIADVPKNVESYLERLDLVYEIGEAVSCVSLILMQHIRGVVIKKFQSYLVEGIKSKVVFEIRDGVVSIIDVWVLVLKISVFFCIGGHIINLYYQLRSCFPRNWKSKVRRNIEIGNWKPKLDYAPYEELTDLFVTATEENLPVKSEVSPSTCCGAETTEMKYQNPISACAHSGHEALLASVLEESHQEEVVCSKNMVEGVSTGHEADVSEATYWNEGPESHELEGFPGSTACKAAISDIEVNEQEPLCSQQEISLKSLLQALTVRAADGIVSPEDTVVDEPMVAVSGKDGSLREKARKSNAVYAGNFIEEGISAENSVVSPEDVVVHVAVDSISGNGGAFCEEARQINPDNAVNYNGQGALEDYSVQWKINWEADFGESLRETVSIPSKRIKYSKAMIMEAGQLENTIEFISDLLDCRGENPVESSKQVETITTVSKTDQVKYVGADCSIAGPLQEGRKSDFSTELDVFHSSENSPIKEPVSPALDSVPCDLQSSILKDGTKVLAAGDVSSLSLKEDENLLLENQLKALTNMPLDGSLGSISQTGSAEGSGSVSDGTFGSSRDAVNSSSILAANTESGFRTYASEIEAIISLQQLHASSPQGGRFPSPNQANNESQGRKKKRSESEEFIQNMASWNSGKIPPRCAAFLKNVLVKPKFKSKQEAALHGHPRLPPQKDDDTSTFDNDTHTEFVSSVAAPEVCTKKVKKEWISRAKFPCRQKSRWSPLLC